MKKISQNTFNKGINMDLNPLTTPKDVLTDCLNGTIITYNGDEFNLQTEYGNSIVTVTGADGEETDALPHGFIPLGVKEFNNILYIVAHNPLTGESRIGSFPSPQRYLPMNIKGDPLLNSRTLDDIEQETDTLIKSLNINHGMSVLTSYLTYGDKYKIMIRLGYYEKNIPWGGEWSDTNEILEKFINNYGTTKSGYFDLVYYIMDNTGKLTPLDITLKPSDTSSTIEYTPTPNNGIVDLAINGTKQLFNLDTSGIVIAALVPKVINSFDYVLKGYNTGGLKSRIVFQRNLIDDSNSAVKVYTIKIVATCTNTPDKFITYFDYKNFLDTSTEDSVEVVLQNLPSNFLEGDVITTVCTPIDQFGRVLSEVDTKFAVQKTYTVSKYLFGTDAHNIFKYKIIGDNLLLHYNFLNTVGKTSDITSTKIEFYDFWSDVSLVIDNPSWLSIDRNAEILVPLADLGDFPISLTFDSNTWGGIPTSSISPSTDNTHILSSKGLVTSLRRNHCYLVRIFGIADNVEYSVFQLLYTLPIPIFVNNYDLVTNFGTIDIIEGMLNTGNIYKTFTTQLTGNLFTGGAIVNTPNVIESATSTASYTTNGGNINEPYRLYGGPVFEEVNSAGVKATGNENTKFYRNVYDGSFKVSTDIESFGYHTFGEIALKVLDLPTNGGVLNSSLFTNYPEKQFLIKGLHLNNSQKDYQFKLEANYSVTAEPINGTVQILPNEAVSLNPLFFGYINTATLNKSLSLSGLNYNITNIFKTSITDSITDSLIWSDGLTYKLTPTNKAELEGTLTEQYENDSIKISKLNLSSQRFTIGVSEFASYVRSYERNKLFSYFSLNHTQNIDVQTTSISNARDINLITKYSFFGFLNTLDGFTISKTSVEGENIVSSNIKNKNTNNVVFSGTINWLVPRILDLPALILSANTEVVNVNESTLSPVYSATPIYQFSFVNFLYSNNPASTVQQTVRKNFRSISPSHVKIGTDDKTSSLYDYSHIWRSNISPFIAFSSSISQEYLHSLAVNQLYKEIIIAQYPGTTITNNSGSSTTLALTSNKLIYTLKTSPGISSTLTKSCFGTSGVQLMTVSRFSAIISTWAKTNIDSVKVVYDFTDHTLSEGLAKNIPWNYVGGFFAEAPINNISLTLIQGSPDTHKNAFLNVKSTIDNSSYLTSSSSIVPNIKVVEDNTLVLAHRQYFKLEAVPTDNNINNSNIFTPKLKEETLISTLVPTATSYGIPYFCPFPPTPKIISGTNSLKVGDIYGGGIIFKLLPEDSNGIQHGLIAATADLEPKIICLLGTKLYGEYEVGANDENDGLTNFTKMKNNSWMTRYDSYVVRAITEFRGTNNLYSDWYLPTTNEMISMFNSAATNLNLSTQAYWTSLEKNCCSGQWWKKAYAIQKELGSAPTILERDKNNSYYSRPIRKF